MSLVSRKGVCPVCAESVTVRRDGRIRSHGYNKGNGETVSCPGTDQEPRQSSDGEFSALCLADGCSEPTAAIVFYDDQWQSYCRLDTLKVLGGPL